MTTGSTHFCLEVPPKDASVSAGGVGHRVVLEECEGSHALLVLLQMRDQLPGPQLPQPHLAGLSASQQEASIVAEHQRGDASSLAGMRVIQQPQVLAALRRVRQDPIDTL